MARATVKQRYFVANQQIVDGKTIIILLEEGKDTLACHNLMKSKEFTAKHALMDLPVRVCILRDEPAYMVQAKPNELAQQIRAVIPGSADKVLGLMSEHGVNIAGEMEVTEVNLEVSIHQPPTQGPQDVPGPSPKPAPEPEAVAASPTPPATTQEASVPAPEPAEVVKYMDQLRIVPADYQVLGHQQLLEIAQKIDQSIDGTCTKLACMAVIGKYLETGQRNVAAVPTQPAVDYSVVPPAPEGYTVEVCRPGDCGAIVWKGPDGRLFDAVEGYPEHNCPGYIKAQAEQRATAEPPTPPPPSGPPPGAEPPPPPPAQVEPPPVIPPRGGFTTGGATSGQASPPTSTQGGIGVPPPPPPPPPAPQ